MLGHQLGQDFIFGLDLPLQVVDSFLLAGMVRPSFRLKRSRPVLEELLLPAVEDRRLQAHLIAKLRGRLLVQQIPP